MSIHVHEPWRIGDEIDQIRVTHSRLLRKDQKYYISPSMEFAGIESGVIIISNIEDNLTVEQIEDYIRDIGIDYIDMQDDAEVANYEYIINSAWITYQYAGGVPPSLQGLEHHLPIDIFIAHTSQF